MKDTPTTSPLIPNPGPHSSRRVSVILLAFTVFILGTHLICSSRWQLAYSCFTRKAKHNTCPQPNPPSGQSHLSGYTHEAGFYNASARRLSGAVKIPTMSFDDMGPVDEDPRWSPFEDMHSYLRLTFPLVYSTVELTVLGGYSLVYIWHGSATLAKPIMLTGHIDVVPSLTALDRWTYPPFSGVFDKEWAYGRGAGDCKNNVIGLMTAVESLISQGWTPGRTIILAFGQDEEIGGYRGSTNIAKYLEGKYGRNGIAMILDEGGMGLENEFGMEFALPGVAEKGFLNTIIDVDMLGGHSSIPTRHTTIGILSKIVSTIEDAPVFQPHLESTSPIWGYLSCIAQHGTLSTVPPWIQKAVGSRNPDMDAVAEKFAQISDENRYLVQTSKAATIFKAGLKSNALAENARVWFNSRIDIFSSPREVQKQFLELIKPIAERYSLLLNGENLAKPPLPSVGNITVSWNAALMPSPISPFSTGSPAWTVLAKAVQAAFGKDVITAPSAMNGGTDTRFYWNLSENIYRWSPTRAGTKLNIHTVDEKLKIQTHVEAIRFYTELILHSDASVSPGF